MELNKVFLYGNLTADPETRYLQSGSAVCKMRLAVNRRMGGGRDQQGAGGGAAEKKDEVLYINVEAWQKTAELCQQYLKRGSAVLIEGRLRLDEYTTKEGEKRSQIVTVAERVQFGPKSAGAEGGQGGQGGYSAGGGGYRQEGGAPPRAAAPRSQAPAQADPGYYPDSGGGEAGGTEDDLPF